MTYHHLKTWPPYFQEILEGKKTFEIRRNDRNFKKGDFLVLEEYQPDNGYTGRTTVRQVGTVVEGEFGIQEGFCVMSLLII